MHNLQERLAAIRGTHQVHRETPFSASCHSSVISPASKQIRHLRQGISITRLGLDDFLDQVNMIPEIAALFTRAVSKDKIDPNAIIREQDALTTLNASNHYFTSKKDAQTVRELDFH